MDLSLSGRRAIVTGGSRGIGLAVARGLHEEGVDVALVSRDLAALERSAGSLGDGARVLTAVADTSSDEEVRLMVEAVAAQLGGVDILVNAAAAPAVPGTPTSLEELDDDDLRREVETKVLGYLRTARAVVPHMKRTGWGRIVNIAGLAARSTGSPVGSVRNIAVAALTKNLADELGSAGINVTAVHPGFTVTERTPSVLGQIARHRGISEEQAEHLLASGSSIGRLVTAREVADVVVFLASPRSVSINGDAVAVGGGAVGPIHY